MNNIETEIIKIQTDKEIFKRGEFENIVLKYKDNIENLQQWELYWLGRSYYKLEKYKECIKVYKLYLEKCKDKDILKNFALWAYYKTLDFYIEKNDKNKILNIGLFIIKNNNKENALLNNLTCNKMIKYISNEKVNVDIYSLYHWNNRLNINELKTEPNVITLDGKIRTLPSEIERYYSTKSKCELKLNFNEHCIATCDEALNSSCFENFVYREWFYFRKAKSLKALEKFDEAIEVLKPILIKNTNSYFKLLLGDIFILKGEKEKGLFYYCDGLYRKEPLDKKVRIIEAVGDLLLEKDPKIAKEHYILTKNLREKNSWSISDDLDKKINHIEILINENEVEKNCKEQWRKIYTNNLEKATGKIARLINPRAGIIKMENGEIYFEKSDLINYNECKIGVNVSFNIIESYDKKKNRLSNKAINIKIIK